MPPPKRLKSLANAAESQKYYWVDANTLPELEASLKKLPDSPGVYQFFDANAQLLYVGKAKNLRNRVKSYFAQGQQHTARIFNMVAQVWRLHTIVTDSEAEAFLLESNLIKTLGPRYNILLRDDKRYPWIGLSAEKYPRLFVTRKPNLKSKARYFGPYPNAGDMYVLLDTIKKYFPLRQRRTPLFKDRPCMNFSIGLCPGPCQDKITPEAYQQTIEQISMLLKGKLGELLTRLEADMQLASQKMAFERAGQLRDAILAINRLAGQQKVISADTRLSQDALGMVTDGHRCAVTILSIRQGKLVRSQSIPYHLAPEAETETRAANNTTLMSQLLSQWETLSVDIPDEILLPQALLDPELLELTEAGLTQKRRETQNLLKKVVISWPQRGEKKGLLSMAEKNARQALANWRQQDAELLSRDPIEALMQLQETLSLSRLPQRMECFDISHFQGSQTVASMVVFEEGRTLKSAYRKFKLRTTEGKPDDFTSMAEAIGRRFAPEKLGQPGWEYPDLLIIDGGKGQLNAALEVIRALPHLKIPPDVISLAKRFEEVYLPGQSHPVVFEPNAPARLLLQEIRDEAHRFAITFHRQLRGKAATASKLDTLMGMGEVRKAKLLDAYKTLSEILQAPPQAIAKTAGVSVEMARQWQLALR
ncbi:MAG: excinuclease ABC subunit UvrC [Vampirovibrionales bacterium]|nr:excinuclease ABC subunit UvrC [Vampirovibrionales bacterium]